MESQDSNIVEFRQRERYQINGIELDLGRLTLLELQVLVQQCQERFMEAHTDLTIVRDTLERRFQEGGAA
jgi:hypothetical protein